MFRLGFLGAVFAALAILGLSSSTTKAEPAVVTNDLNLRYGPGLEYPVILTMEYGSVVEVKQCYDDEWCEVQYRDYYGFAHSGYLDFAVYAPRYVTPPRVVTVPRYYYDPYPRYYRDYREPRRTKRHNYAPRRARRHDYVPPRAAKKNRRKARAYIPNRQHRVNRRSVHPRALPRRVVKPRAVKKRARAAVQKFKRRALKNKNRSRPRRARSSGRKKNANRARARNNAAIRQRGGSSQPTKNRGKTWRATEAGLISQKLP